MFNIAFTDRDPEVEEDGSHSLWGRITLGPYHESFLSPVGTWQRSDYERQWIEAVERLLAGGDSTAFMVQPLQGWWVMWRVGEAVYVHEQLLLPERLAGYDDVHAVPYLLIGDHVTTSDEAEPISEWRVSMDDIREFVERRADRFHFWGL